MRFFGLDNGVHHNRHPQLLTIARGPTLDEIRTKGLLALRNELGPVGMIRFLQLFSNGSGDYAKDRHAWVDNTSMEEIIAQTSLGRKKKNEFER
jgi:hypothetical protein